MGVGTEIYVIDADGGNLLRLTNPPEGNWEPSWSPDGERIVFVSGRDGTPEIYVMNADGTDQTRLTDDQTHENDPAWSPDGRFIAYASAKHVDAVLAQRIHLMTANGEYVKRLGGQHRGDDDDPDWYDPQGWAVSPASNKIITWGRMKERAQDIK